MGKITKAGVYTTLLFAMGLYVSVTYNACSDVDFESLPLDVASLSVANISINNGDTYTTEKEVTLSIEPANSYEMFISNSADCSDGYWQPSATRLPWVLPAENNVVSVYARFRMVDGGMGPCISDNILHDNIPPEIAFSQSQGQWFKSTDQVVPFKVRDLLAGVDKVTCAKAPDFEKKDCVDQWVGHNLKESENHVLIVHATDKAGNEAVPGNFHWGVDLTKPEVIINSQPPSVTNSAIGEVVFSSKDSPSGVAKSECRYNQGPWSQCVDKFVKNGLTSGSQVVEVRAIDLAGNVSPVARAQWTVDQEAPSVRITGAPAAIGNSRTARFNFEGDDKGQPITIFECKLDANPYESCTDPKVYTGIADGQHKFYVVGFDAAGNKSAPASYSWEVDTVVPTISFTKTPKAISRLTTANFSIKAQDAASSIDVIECSLDNAAFKACAALLSFADIKEGNHSLRARAKDKAGNVSETISYSWLVDLTPPKVELTSVPPKKTLDKTGEFQFEGQDVGGSGIKSFDCKISGVQGYQPCTSPFGFGPLLVGNYTFTVRARDMAGNISDPEIYSWLIGGVPPLIAFIEYPQAPVVEEEVGHVLFDVVDQGGGIGQVTCVYNGSPIACAPGVKVDLGAMPKGNHSFTVYTEDQLGTKTDATKAWFVELKPIICVEGKRLGIWLDPDQSGNLVDENYLGSIVSYEGKESAANNYNYYSYSAHPIVGPVPLGFEMNVFFYEGPDGLALNVFANIDSNDQSTGSSDNIVNLDVLTSGNNMMDSVLLSDDNQELKHVSSVADGKSYEGRFHYWYNTDGGVVGPFNGDKYKIQTKILESGDIQNARFFSSDGTTFTLKDASQKISSFVIAFKTYQVCSK